MEIIHSSSYFCRLSKMPSPSGIREKRTGASSNGRWFLHLSACILRPAGSLPDRVLFPGTFLLMWARSKFQLGALSLCLCPPATAVSSPSSALPALGP